MKEKSLIFLELMKNASLFIKSRNKGLKKLNNLNNLNKGKRFKISKQVNLILLILQLN